MLSRNNVSEQIKRYQPKKQHFALKKLTVGVASVLLGVTFATTGAHADTAITNTDQQPISAQSTASDESKDSSSVRQAQSSAVATNHADITSASDKSADNSSTATANNTQSATAVVNDHKTSTTPTTDPNRVYHVKIM
ncbi:MAG: YSIRK-type signal peptide-containing protein, partial [Candidatus Limosilactobacillus intestinavium]